MSKQFLFVALLVLLLSSLIPPADSAAAADPTDKIGALLAYQLALKQEFLSHPDSSVAQALSASAGNHWDPGRQRLLVYLDQAPSLRFLQQIQSFGIVPYPDTWVPPVGMHPMGVMLADTPTSRVMQFASLDEVVRLETAEQVFWPSNDLAAKKSEVKFVQGLGYTGAGIRVVVLDAGLDTLHADIPNPVAAKDYSGFPHLDDDVLNPSSGHGTHVTATLLGRGGLSGSKYAGMAPGADLVFLKIGSDEEGAPARLDAFFAAIKAAVDVYGAEIINISYGGWDAYHDGTSALAQVADYAAWRGTLVFCAAGNGAAEGLHASIQLMSPASLYGQVAFHVADGTRLVLQVVWNDGPNRREPYMFTLLDADHNLITTLEGKWSPESPVGTESLLLTGPVLSAGSYALGIRSAAANTGARRLHVYSQDDSTTFVDPDPKYTLDTPADAARVIAVAAHVSRTYWTNYQGLMFGFSPTPGQVDEVATYSSMGPTVDERAKPDIAAPGTALISARDRAYPAGGESDWLIVDNDATNDGQGPADYYVMEGTSMACPVAAGAAALLLDSYPSLRNRSDTAEIIRNALRDGAITHRIPLQEGAGFLNLRNTYTLLRPYQQPSATPLPSWTPTETPSSTATVTKTATRTPSRTPTPGLSATATTTHSPAPSATVPVSPEPSATVGISPTTTPTGEPSSQTPTASPTPTPSESQQTRTATATATPTGTATPTATPTIVRRGRAYLPLVSRGMVYLAPTATPSVTPHPTETPGAPLAYYDDFSDPGSGWAETDVAAYSLGYTGGEYRVAIRAYDWKVPSFAPFTATMVHSHISVSARQALGDAAAYGIVFADDQVRAFLVSPLGYVAVWRYNPETASWYALSDWQACDAVVAGSGVNVLAVEVAGGTAAFYVNRVKLPLSVPIPEGGSPVRRFGIIGVSYSPSPVDLRFDDFEVQSLDASGWAK